MRAPLALKPYECKEKGYIQHNLTPRAFAEVRQTRGTPLIGTEDFTPAEVKEIASERLVIIVKDTGIGIAPDDLPTFRNGHHRTQIAGRFIAPQFPGVFGTPFGCLGA